MNRLRKYVWMVERWLDGFVDKQTVGWMGGWMTVCMYSWMNRLIKGHKNRSTEGWINMYTLYSPDSIRSSA